MHIEKSSPIISKLVEIEEPAFEFLKSLITQNYAF